MKKNLKKERVQNDCVYRNLKYHYFLILSCVQLLRSEVYMFITVYNKEKHQRKQNSLTHCSFDLSQGFNNGFFVISLLVGETAAGDEKLLKDLPSEGYQKLVEHLQPLSATGRDYRSLADKMGYSNQYIQWLGSTDNPVMNLLRKFRENDRKISEMTSLLKEMERNDVLEDLQPYVG